MSEDLKTIKELAEELGFIKQTIQYHVKSLPTKNRLKNSSGAIVLNLEEQRFIKNRLTKNRPNNDQKSTKEPTKNRPKKDKEISMQKEGENVFVKLLPVTTKSNDVIIENLVNDFTRDVYIECNEKMYSFNLNICSPRLTLTAFTPLAVLVKATIVSL